MSITRKLLYQTSDKKVFQTYAEAKKHTDKLNKLDQGDILATATLHLLNANDLYWIRCYLDGATTPEVGLRMAAGLARLYAKESSLGLEKSLEFVLKCALNPSMSWIE